MRVHRSVLAITSLAAGLAVIPLTFAGATRPVEAAATDLSVTFMLAPNDPAALQQLATSSGIPPAERSRAIAHARASTATAAALVARIRAAGLTVTSTTPFSVIASGAPAAVTSFIGSRKAMRAHPGSRSASTSDGIPASLRGLVVGIVGGDDTTTRMHPMVVEPVAATPASLQTLYHGVNGTPPPGKPPLTIATIQFSGWNTQDLTDYAQLDLGLPDPTTNGQYTGVSVDGASISTPDGNGGDIEVALDQETLLGLAPSAQQRAYIAPNTSQGFVDAINQIASESSAQHIGALSISWGGCEASWLPTEIDAMHAAFVNLLANGVTTFSASGDNGMFDCSTSLTPNPSAAVDYPASDPFVIGVGGTTVYSDGSQGVWSETLRKIGSGGGYSGVFTRPSYQVSVNTPPATLNTTYRMVPDISAVGDPASGLTFRYHDLTTAHHDTLGGTSLATPVSAALFSNTLSNRGWQSGIGDIHTNLYVAPAASFVDVVSGGGDIAWPAARGYDLGTGLGTPLWAQLRTSYDGAPVLHAPTLSNSRTIPISVTSPQAMAFGHYRSGVGTPPTIDPAAPCDTTGQTVNPPTSAVTGSDGSKTVWVIGIVDAAPAPTPTMASRCYLSSAQVLVDTVKPTAAITAPAAGFVTSTSTTLTFTRTDGSGSGIARSEYRVAKAAANASTAASAFGAAVSVGTAASKVLTGFTPGQQYCFQVRAVDKAGNVGSWTASRCIVVPYDDRSFTASSGWARGTAAGFIAGTRTSTGLALQTLTSTSTRVVQVGVVATKCATCGSMQVFVGTTLVGTINLAATSTSRALVTLPRFTAAKIGVVKLVTTSNKPVTIDAIAIVGR